MSDICPTVRIKADNPDGYCLINADDFDKDKHTLAEGEAPGAEEDRPDDSGSDEPHNPTHDEKGVQVEIPADWQSLKWTKKEKLAKAIVGQKDGPLVTAEGQTRAQKAEAIIAAEVEGRAA